MVCHFIEYIVACTKRLDICKPKDCKTAGHQSLKSDKMSDILGSRPHLILYRRSKILRLESLDQGSIWKAGQHFQGDLCGLKIPLFICVMKFHSGPLLQLNCTLVFLSCKIKGIGM